MRIILITIIMLLFCLSCMAMTEAEFVNLKTGDLVRVKLEWAGKVYLEGDGVVAYKLFTTARVCSTDPAKDFLGAFRAQDMTLLESKTSNDGQAQLKQKDDLIAKLKAIISQLISSYNALAW